MKINNSFSPLLAFLIVPAIIYGWLKMNPHLNFNEYEWVWWAWIGIAILIILIFGVNYKKKRK